MAKAPCGCHALRHYMGVSAPCATATRLLEEMRRANRAYFAHLEAAMKAIREQTEEKQS